MVTRKGIDFFPLSRSRWTKLSFPACGAARQALNLSASFLCLSQLDIKPQGLWCGCCCPPGDFLAVLRKVTLLFWRPQGTREPVLSDTFSGHNTPMSPAQSGMAVGLAQSWLPAHTTRATLQWQRVAETRRPIWPEHCLAAEKSGSVPLPTSVPARELGRREEGVMAESR